ncbi:GNAT family N-acetyltransferase [Kribbella sp. CA-247076]|uniref:GNAT family N-acetyltransferase n=1 Tax=Kribbella sp. CA-247076 TaxID=3239941 RepID=UPI003D8EF0E1
MALVWEGERVVGAADCQLPQAENRAVLFLDLVVHPEFRCRGIGSRLLNEVDAIAQRHDRTLIEVQVERDAAGFRYLTKRGHQPGATSIRSICKLSGRATASLADGYELVQWRDFAPEEIVDDVAALQSRLMVDAPSGDLTVEQQVYDAERVRRQEKSEHARGHRSYSTAARHVATGHIVARTKLAFETDDDTHARQRITIVEPAHRGRRLGLAVKSANHAYAKAQEPALQVVEAWNSEDNTHMRAVNAALGFEPVDRWSVFQLPVPATSGARA